MVFNERCLRDMWAGWIVGNSGYLLEETIMWLQPDLNRQLPTAVFRTGPRPRVRRYARYNARRHVRRNAKICKIECQKECQKICQKGCQKIRQKHVRRYMPETMSKDVPERMSERPQPPAPDGSVPDWTSTASSGRQLSPPDLNRESEDVPDSTPERMPERMSEGM